MSEKAPKTEKTVTSEAEAGDSFGKKLWRAARPDVLFDLGKEVLSKDPYGEKARAREAAGGFEKGAKIKIPEGVFDSSGKPIDAGEWEVAGGYVSGTVHHVLLTQKTGKFTVRQAHIRSADLHRAVNPTPRGESREHPAEKNPTPAAGETPGALPSHERAQETTKEWGSINSFYELYTELGVSSPVAAKEVRQFLYDWVKSETTGGGSRNAYEAQAGRFPRDGGFRDTLIRLTKSYIESLPRFAECTSLDELRARIEKINELLDERRLVHRNILLKRLLDADRAYTIDPAGVERILATLPETGGLRAAAQKIFAERTQQNETKHTSSKEAPADILGIVLPPDWATSGNREEHWQAIRKAFKELSQKYHPDKATDDAEKTTFLKKAQAIGGAHLALKALYRKTAPVA